MNIRKSIMTPNKQTVHNYMEAFKAIDHEAILACLTDDVIWHIPGTFTISGKEAFDKEIENENFTGKPIIEVIRMVEENDIVIAEGTVQCKLKDGPILNLVFCDVFHMQDAKIKQLTSYLMNTAASNH
ncbi:nuclear transport factor 2 family protein [Flavobacterium sp. SM15]|uniref:nuclear transport factor 2 family protein n=1 Tax=Flavobacterium sp. SM15 TaxID=2908005 RepID=UPI001EDAA30F|nr:nuclear transport factor 2 family protein [Flavobacterium sp. SM15]MCG2612335.1 nuclear transport factor 2 family protein [Flavobacterium sp. SM15]